MHLFSRPFLSEAEEKQIHDAIEHAEMQTSGEVRLHLEPYCKMDPLDRAADVFGFLHMHETKERNGVLFYLAFEDHRFAIIGDAGINAKVPAGFWDEIRDTVMSHFAGKKYAEGLEKGIRMAGEKLKEHFPRQHDDDNELKNDISYGHH